MGARVKEGRPLPDGWAGKTWALQQGLEAARGEWVVFLDADTRPRPGLIAALVEAAAPYELLSAAPRFVCEGAAERVLHPAMAATLVYRFGPLDVDGWQPRPRRALANGQCIVVAREPFLAAGGWTRVRGALTEDVALARAVRARGGLVGFVDAADLLEVRMYASARETWTGWARSLMAADATAPAALVGDVALLWLAVALPLPRLLCRRGSPLDVLLLALRVAIHAALARGYARPRGAAYALAPLLDAPVTAWLAWRAIRPSRTWRGRTYAPARKRSPISPMSPPVAATRDGASSASWASGKPKTPARAPHAKDRVPRLTTTHAASATAAASGLSANAPPANVITDLPPRPPAKSGNACPSMAPATPAYAPPTPASTRPARPAKVPLSASPTNAGHARRAPSCSSAFHAPGLPSPVARRSTSWRRATSSAAGTDPSR